MGSFLILTLEALTAVNIKVLGKVRTFKPGERFTLPEDQAQKLLGLAVGKVRVIEDKSSQLYPGVWIEFFSPLFGMCTARIHVVTVEGYIITDHSVLKVEGEPVTIPAAWVRGVYRGNP